VKRISAALVIIASFLTLQAAPLIGESGATTTHHQLPAKQHDTPHDNSTGSISGTVTSTTGVLGEICVQAQTTGGSFGGAATTASDGTYTISNLSPAAYTVWFSDCNNIGGYSGRYYDDTTFGTSLYSSAAPVVVTAGITSQNVNVTLATGGEVTGTVKDTSGNPIAGICVSVNSGSGGYGGQPTGADGTYLVSGVPSGSYTVQFYDCSDSGWATAYYETGQTDGTSSFTNATSISVTSGQPTSGINIEMSKGGSISGTVFDATTNNPISGICVSAQSNSGGFGGQPTDANGDFTLTGIPAGNYVVQFYDCAQGVYATTYYSAMSSYGTSSYGAASPVTVTVGSTTSDISVNLSAGASLSGTVLDATTNNPISGICVSAQSNSGGFGGQPTDANGNYTITGLPAGTYSLVFSDCSGVTNYATTYYDQNSSGTDLYSSATKISVNPGDQDGSLDVSMGEGGTITGTITAAVGGAPLQNICVSAQTNESGFGGQPTAADGSYSITGLPAGSYVLQFTDCGTTNYASQYYSATSPDHGTTSYFDASAVTVSAGATRSGINSALSEGGSISGTITEANSPTTPLANICVFADSSDSGYGGQVSAPDGTYSLTGIPAGSYKIQFYNCGTSNYAGDFYSSTSVTGTQNWSSASQVTVTAGVNTAAIDTELSAGGEVTGTVQDTSANPLSGICVSALGNNSGYGGAPTDQNGDFTLTGIAPGSYKIQYYDCSTGQYISEFYNDTTTGTTSYSAASNVSVSANNTTVIATTELGVGGSISGTVTEADGVTPIAGICVSAQTNNSGFGGQPTDAGGNYTISGLAPGYYTIQFNDCMDVGNYASAYFDYTLEGTSQQNNAAQLQVAVGQPLSGVNISLVTGNTISGTVTDADGNPLSGICVSAQTNNSGFGGQPTDSDGHYSLTGLPTGSYKVQFYDCNTGAYSTIFYKSPTGSGPNYGTSSYNSASEVTVPVNGTGTTASGISVAMQLGGSITGVVEDASGKPLSGICVSAEANNSGYGGQPSGSDGSFAITGLPSGTYRVQYNDCQNSGYSTSYYETPGSGSFTTGTSSNNSATLVTVVVGQATPIDIMKMSLGGSISGTITTSDGTTPLAGMCVSVMGNGSGYGGSPSNHLGQYTVTGIPAGTYSVEFTDCNDEGYANVYYGGANSPGVASYSLAASVTVTAGGVVTNINGSMSLGGSISGVVQDSSSNGLSGICVSANSNSAGNGTASGDGGTFTISGLSPGTYTVNFSDCSGMGYSTAYYVSGNPSGTANSSNATQVIVTAGQTTALTTITQLTQGGTLSGTVSISGGGAAANVCVTALANSQGVGWAQTDTSGNFTISGISAGTYDLYFSNCTSATSYISAYYASSSTGSASPAGALAVTVASGQTESGIDITLALGASISGTITDATTHAPIGSICVGTQTSSAGYGGTIDNSNGTYTITGVPIGIALMVSFSACNGSMYITDYYSSTSPTGTTFGQASTVTLTSGEQLTGINVAMTLGGIASGTVTYAGGTMPSNICVSYIGTSAGFGFIVNPNGTYTTQGLPPGTYRVSVNSCMGGTSYVTDYYVSGSSIGSLNFSSASQVTITAGQATTGINLELVDSGSTPHVKFSVAGQSSDSDSQSHTAQAQSITVTSPPTSEPVGTTYVPTVSASSGLSVSLNVDPSSTSNSCTINSGSVSFTGIGTCIIDFNQSGNTSFTAAPQIQTSIQVVQGSQTISFTSSAPLNAAVGGTTYLPVAQASSFLSVLLAADPSSQGVCTLSAGVVSFIGAGTCTVDATQSGNSNYSPAPQVQQSFLVALGSQSISFQSSPPSGLTVGSTTYYPVAVASSRLAVTVTIDPSSSGVCAIHSGTVSFTSAGTCVVDANQYGGSGYAPASQVQQDIVVAAVPVSGGGGGGPSGGGGGGGGGSGGGSAVLQVGLSAVGSSSSVTLQWSAPFLGVSTTIVGYEILESTDGTTFTPVISDTQSTATTTQISGLNDGTTYYFEVAVYYEMGGSNQPQLSIASAVAPATPVGPPSAPSDLSVTVSGTTAELTWAAPSTSGTLNYVVSSSTGTFSCSSTTTSCSISGLTPGSYTFSVVAKSDNGTSSSVSASPVVVSAPKVVIPVPTAPTISVTSKSIGKIIITLTKRSTSFVALISYQYSLNGGAWKTVGAVKMTSWSLSGLKAGEIYAVRLRALNKSGASVASRPVAIRVL
jgi:protocatechuate 3,4-dioxygenase beta subunit